MCLVFVVGMLVLLFREPTLNNGKHNLTLPYLGQQTTVLKYLNLVFNFSHDEIYGSKVNRFDFQLNTDFY